MYMHAPYDRLIYDVTDGRPVGLGFCNHNLATATNGSTEACKEVDGRGYDGGVGTSCDRLIPQDPVRTSMHMHSLAQCISRQCLDSSMRLQEEFQS